MGILWIYDSHFVPVLTLRKDDSGIVPRQVRILTLSANLGILTLCRAILKLSRFSLCAEHLYYRYPPREFNGSIYMYIERDDSFQNILNITSKGKFLWEEGFLRSFIL